LSRVAQTLKPFISERRLAVRVRALGRAIRADYRGRDLVLVGILKGSFIFMADLARAIAIPLTCDFLRVSSYGSGTVSSGRIRTEFSLSQPVKGKDVVVVEDIVDTGWTLDHVMKELRRKKPRSLRLAALLHKPERTRVQVPIDYLGFTIPDRFVVGYGLDFDGRYRNLRHLAVLGA
jgi:hypoxanthine phosphoribosyltransferase